MSESETIVIAVGGSLIVPDQIDAHFLEELKSFITSQVANGKHFVIVAGGGKTARVYAQAANNFDDVPQADVDEIGITACQINAHLLRILLQESKDAVLVNPDRDFFQPGASSDRVAVRTAIKYGAKKLINMSNISHVYTADPNKDADAVKLEDITWDDFRKLIPEKWEPGLSSPFDPEAAKDAQTNNIEVATISGENLTELSKYLDGEAFVGTKIHP